MSIRTGGSALVAMAVASCSGSLLDPRYEPGPLVLEAAVSRPVVTWRDGAELVFTLHNRSDRPVTLTGERPGIDPFVIQTQPTRRLVIDVPRAGVGIVNTLVIPARGSVVRRVPIAPVGGPATAYQLEDGTYEASGVVQARERHLVSDPVRFQIR